MKNYVETKVKIHVKYCIVHTKKNQTFSYFLQEYKKVTPQIET